ncbi:MAG: MFS transporter [Promethearchaeota archaeon]
MEDKALLRELHGKRLIGYTLGSFGITLTNIFSELFSFQFYVYTINLDSLLVSIGLSLNIFISAKFAIIFGVMADNKKPGRFGKRRPFLLIGLPIWVLTNIIIWFPPWKCPQNNSMFLPTALFFWAVSITKSIFGTLIFNVYLSMLPEQSQTLKNRELVASIRVFFRIIASVISLFLPLLVQSILEDPQNVKWWQPSGKVILTYIPIIGLIFTGFGLVSVLFTYFSVDESFHKFTPGFNKKKISIKSVISHMSLPAKDKKFRILVIAEFILSLAGFWGLLIFSFQTYVLNYRESQFFIYVLISLGGKLGWYFFWSQIIKKKTDTQGLFNLYVVNRLIGGTISFLVLFYFIPTISAEASLVLYVIVFGTILGSNYSVPLFSIPINASIIHKAAEKEDSENIDKSISEISGIYYGFSTFMFSAGYALSTFIAGFILTGSNAENPIIILILIAVRGVFAAISLVFLRKLKFNDL